MSDPNPIIPAGDLPALPKPSQNLLDLFAQQAEHLRMKAADHRVTASAAHEAHQVAAREADELTAHYQHLLSEVERLQQLAAQARTELDAKLKAADEHRARAARHGEAADELLNDAVFCDGTIKRAQSCPCGGPSAPNYDEQRESCPIHRSITAPVEQPPAPLVPTPTDTRTDPPPPAEEPTHHSKRTRGSKHR